jgi:hypothetical protein
MGGMVFVPEGQADRSQTRSAWESVPRKNQRLGSAPEQKQKSHAEIAKITKI